MQTKHKTNDPYAFQPLKRISTVEYSLDFSVTTLGSMGLVSFIPCRGRERRLDDTDTTLVISDATNLKIAAKGFLAKYSFRLNIELRVDQAICYETGHIN